MLEPASLGLELKKKQNSAAGEKELPEGSVFEKGFLLPLPRSSQRIPG